MSVYGGVAEVLGADLGQSRLWLSPEGLSLPGTPMLCPYDDGCIQENSAAHSPMLLLPVGLSPGRHQGMRIVSLETKSA